MSQRSRSRAMCVVLGIALAVPAAAIAQDEAETSQSSSKTYDETVFVNAADITFVNITKDISVSKSIAISGLINVLGELIANESAMSTIDDKQIISDNRIDIADSVTNSVAAGSAVLSSSDGNINLNLSAGDNIVQDNATALAMIEPTTAGAGDAQIYALQKSLGNVQIDGPFNQSVENSASLLDDVLQGASGNVGVNVAAGSFNAQKNSLGIAFVIGTAVLAEASSGGLQQTTQNVIAHTTTVNTSEIGANALADSSGTITINVVSGANNLQANSSALTLGQ